jgi:hypothetical protein
MAGMLKRRNAVSPEKFVVPKWKKIDGDEHILTNRDIEYDLLSIEEFLNNMIAHGWKPVWVSGGVKYAFVKCEPGEFICRTISSVTKGGLFNKKQAAELTAELVADGAEVIPQRRTLGSQIGLIALRNASLGEFDLFTDAAARIVEYEARIKVNQTTAIMFYVLAALYFTLGLSSDNSMPWLGLAPLWIILGSVYMTPLKRYKEIVAALRAEEAEAQERDEVEDDETVDDEAEEVVLAVEDDELLPVEDDE